MQVFVSALESPLPVGQIGISRLRVETGLSARGLTPLGIFEGEM